MFVDTNKKEDQKVIEGCEIFLTALFDCSNGINKYYLIMYSMTTLLTADINQKNYKELNRKANLIQEKKLVKKIILKLYLILIMEFLLN